MHTSPTPPAEDPLRTAWHDAQRLVQAEAPSPGTRERILAHARSTRSRPAANDARWRIAALGSVTAMSLAGLLAWQLLHGPVEPGQNHDASVAAPATAAAPPAAPPAASPAASSAAPGVAQADRAREDGRMKADGIARRSPRPRRDEAGSGTAPAAPEAAAPAASTAPAPATPAAPAAEDRSRPFDHAGESVAREQAVSPAMASRADGPPAPSPSSSTATATAALAAAAARGDVDAMRRAIAGGAALDEPDTAGHTPLMAAVRARRTEAVRLLLEAGADPRRRDRTHVAPLQQALRQGDAAIAEQLIAAGAGD